MIDGGLYGRACIRLLALPFQHAPQSQPGKARAVGVPGAALRKLAERQQPARIGFGFGVLSFCETELRARQQGGHQNRSVVGVRNCRIHVGTRIGKPSLTERELGAHRAQPADHYTVRGNDRCLRLEGLLDIGFRPVAIAQQSRGRRQTRQAIDAYTGR